jgi:hypothetical protein
MITIAKNLRRRPRGIVRLYEHASGDWSRQPGRLIWERENLIVNTALTALANLAGGVTAGESVAAIGFGSGGTPPAPGDVGLSATPAYYRAIGAATIGPAGGVAAGSVQFAYTLATTDYGANPLTIVELGLFGNTGAVNLPAAAGTANPNWAASIAKVVGNLIVDSNGNIQRCTTAGNTGTAAPAWATTIGATTNDFTGGGTAVWTLVALHTAPGPMIANVSVPAFAYTGAGNYAGTWTLTF